MSHCGKQVWFGEEVPEIDLAIEVTQTADLFVIVGTTMQVQPAASLSCFPHTKKINF